MGPRRIDLLGRQFGDLEVIEFSHATDQGAYWKCTCACGKETIKVASKLLKGLSLSCGCAGRKRQRQLVTKHAMHDTPTYHTWEGMKQRCLNPNAKF
jgi:hypothetical protein